MQLTYVPAPTGYAAPMNFVGEEYPKYVHFPDGRTSVIVKDADEEAAARQGEVITPKPDAPASPPAPIVNLVGQNDEESMLRKIAAEKNIRIDGRWKLPKIRKAVEAASR